MSDIVEVLENLSLEVIQQQNTIQVISPNEIEVIQATSSVIVEETNYTIEIGGGSSGGSSISQESGWSISGAYSTRKTLDPTNYTQQQLVELVCTLVDLLKTSTLPGT